MSCFVLDDHHINVLVSYAANCCLRYRDWRGKWLDVQGREQEVAALLHSANVSAFEERYRTSETFDPIVYHRVILTGQPEQMAVQILKACNCFSYQAGDWSEFEFSAAARIVLAIKNEACCHIAGYAEAKWVLHAPTVSVELEGVS